MLYSEAIHLPLDSASTSLLALHQHRAIRTSNPVPQMRVASPAAQPATPLLQVQWAKHKDEVTAAQRLRYLVFCGEMGAGMDGFANPGQTGLDHDEFDDYCEHLLIKDLSTSKVVGTYRLLMPAQAQRLGTTYMATQFDMRTLRESRERMVELGRSCVHPDYRDGAVIRLLGGAIFKFMQANQFEQMIGCASIPMSYQGTRNGDAAASIWQRVKQSHLATDGECLQPLLPLPLAQLNGGLNIDPPPLIAAYLRMGAKVLGPPSWDPHFNTADLPIMARLSDLPTRFRKHFLGE